MNAADFRPEDALFPPISKFNCLSKVRSLAREPIVPMTSCHAVTQAFQVACNGHHTAYTPHAAKHTIAAERDRRRLTMLQRKAWSANMGHENEQTTSNYYGKVSNVQRLELKANLPHKDIAGGGSDLTDEAKIALVDAVLERVFVSD